MATVALGANLVPVMTSQAQEISKALELVAKLIQHVNGNTVTQTGKTRSGCRVFMSNAASAPTTNTAADDPGQDLCLVIYRYLGANDVYLIHTWTAAATFVAVKILEGTAV